MKSDHLLYRICASGVLCLLPVAGIALFAFILVRIFQTLLPIARAVLPTLQ